MRRRHEIERTSREREALIGLECALPSRELRLASTEPRTRRSVWRRALDWLRSGFGAGQAQAH